VGFLTLLGVAFPPVGAIMVVDYFVLRTYRRELDEARAAGRLPREVPLWNPIGLVTWLVASVAGYYIGWGIQSVNSLIIAGVLYFVLSKLLPVMQPGARKATA
jgi:cytosine permease